jgi:3-oxoacyl-[acyl-carrier-protein] synthase III
MSSYITGCGAALPARVVTNDDLAPLLGITPDWIWTNSGIRERRWVEDTQSTSDLAAAAVQDALRNCGLTAESVDYLIGCTLSPDYQVPGIAPVVQSKLSGIRGIPAVDLRVGCAAILYSLQLARGLTESGAAKTVVCVGAEAQSKGLCIKPEYAELSMLFGDGAGALVVTNASHPCGDNGFSLRIHDVMIATDGRFVGDLIVRAPGTANGKNWLDQNQIESNLHLGSMNGRTVILQAVRKLAEVAGDITNRCGIALDQVDLVIPHQANANLIRQLSKQLSLPYERIVTNVEVFGNTSGASAFLALWNAYKEERLRPGSWVLFLAFGAGFTWGATLCRVCEMPEGD